MSVDRRPHSSEPVEMSAAEKLACEREARHDVVGRGRIADLAPVQHYLSHVRAEGGMHASGNGQPARGRPRRDTPREDRSAGLRSWLRWGEDGGPEHPVIPRC